MEKLLRNLSLAAGLAAGVGGVGSIEGCNTQTPQEMRQHDKDAEKFCRPKNLTGTNCEMAISDGNASEQMNNAINQLNEAELKGIRENANAWSEALGSPDTKEK
jgi:hypothetical protein